MTRLSVHRRASTCFPRMLCLTLLLVASRIVLAQSSAPSPAQAAAAQPQLPPDQQAQLDKFKADLDAARAKHDPAAEADALGKIGRLYYNTSNYSQALDYYNQGLSICHAQGYQLWEAAVLTCIGQVYSNLGDTQKALDYYNRALPIRRAVGDRHGEAITLSSIGIAYSDLGDKKKALEYYDQALPIQQAIGDREGEAKTLVNIGAIYDDLGDKQTALDFYNQALPVQHAIGDRRGEAATLDNIGLAYSDRGEPQKALDLFNQALSIRRVVGNRDGEAASLSNIGTAHEALGDIQKALDFFNQALLLYQAVGDRGGEAAALNNIGYIYKALSENRKALDYYNQALSVLRSIGDRSGEATTLNNIGNFYDNPGEQQKALDYYSQALVIYQATGERGGEATTLNNIGQVYGNVGEDQRALGYFYQALPIQQAINDRRGEATTLNNIGAVYDDLGDKQSALDFYNRSLAIFRDIGDRASEATLLNNIGHLCDELGEQRKALDYYNQALVIYQDVGDREGEAVTLNNIGHVYSSVGNQQKALEYYNQALLIFHAIGGLHHSEASTLVNIGAAYEVIGDKQKALDNYHQALPTAIEDPLLESQVLYALFINQRASNPSLAIFYGKLSVNFLQQVRGNIRGLDKDLQQDFLTSKNNVYRDLADLLINQKRFPEAMEILDLLKDQEFADYVRGDPDVPLHPATLTPAEQQAEKDYQNQTAQLVTQSQRLKYLAQIKERTPAEDTELKQLQDQQDAATRGFESFLGRLYILFSQNTAANTQKADIEGDVATLEAQIAAFPNAVGLRTVVTKDRFNVIVVTGTTTVGRLYPIGEDDLNKKIVAFTQVLKNPKQDPLPLASELYKILIGPVKADLDQAHAATLIWSLDGALRYIPMAALYDSEKTKYLVEEYASVAITPISIQHLAEQPELAHPNALGMGISQKYRDGMKPLSTVKIELDDVVNDPKTAGAKGVLPGTILLNDQFTKAAMESQLNTPHPIVHIASHFVFKPGDSNNSYLLLAGKDDKDTGGYLMSVADFNNVTRRKFSATDLLTLSACETGMSGNASNGEEIDGLAGVALKNQAKAVLSTLWSVNDSSTGSLMADFYKRWANGAGKTMKVEALRQAQLDLLTGKTAPTPNYTNPNAPTSYIHPYYWAPFVLVGNWR